MLWTGQAVSVIGIQLTRIAIPIHIYSVTGSSLMVGLISLAQLVPLLVCSLLGGSIADAVDRRKLMITMQSLLTLVVAGLAALAMVDAPLWPWFLLAAVSAGLSAIDSPSRSASIATLVGRDRLAAASALNQSLNQTGQIVGPALGGVLIAAVGVSAAFWVNVATFLVSIVMVSRMRPMGRPAGARRAGFASVAEGLRFLRGKRALQGCFLADINAMVFGMPRALFPALGLGLYGGDAAVVGLLYAAPGVGALLGALTAGWVSTVKHHGRWVIIAIAVWGGSIAGFGFSRFLWLSLPLLALAGAADVISAVFRQTILQLSVPDNLRGRISAVHIGVVTGGPLVGDARAGAVASVSSPEVAVVSGGLVCMATIGLMAWRIPALRRWTLDDAVPEETSIPEKIGGRPATLA
jgi:MFS family permease